MNRIGKIIMLDDQTKYMKMDQGNYNQKCYFMMSKLDNFDNLTEEFSIMEEEVVNGESLLSKVTNSQLLEALAKYFRERALKSEEMPSL